MGVEKVEPELIKEHLVALLVAAVVLRVVLLDAVVGQMARHVLQVRAVVRLRGSPQHALAIQVDVVLMVHQHPAPGDSKASFIRTARPRGTTQINMFSLEHLKHRTCLMSNFR